MRHAETLARLRKEYPVHTFAGLTYPRTIYTLPRLRGSRLLECLRARKGSCCGPYYRLEPSPNPSGWFFYLESDFALGARWQWADDIAPSIRHRGWFTDAEGMGDTIRGLVFRLPRGRGFLAGWSMGEGMASHLDAGIWTDERDAAHAADDSAKCAAEREREYQENERDAEGGDDE